MGIVKKPLFSLCKKNSDLNFDKKASTHDKIAHPYLKQCYTRFPGS